MEKSFINFFLDQFIKNLQEQKTYQAVRLFGSSTASRTEQMATFSRLRAKAAAAMALSGTVDFAEPLAVVFSFAPATALKKRLN